MLLKSKEAKDTCEIYFVDEEKVRSIKKTMKPDSVFNGLSETFKVLGDPTRAKIIYILSQEELCVCDIANILGLSVSAVSHQLRVLRNLKLVKYHKEGKMAFYSLDDKHIANLFAESLEHALEQAL